MVESQPSKLLVAGSIPVSRSILCSPKLVRWPGGLAQLRKASRCEPGSAGGRGG